MFQKFVQIYLNLILHEELSLSVLPDTIISHQNMSYLNLQSLFFTVVPFNVLLDPLKSLIPQVMG